jgi:hypothetical protein
MQVSLQRLLESSPLHNKTWAPKRLLIKHCMSELRKESTPDKGASKKEGINTGPHLRVHEESDSEGLAEGLLESEGRTGAPHNLAEAGCRNDDKKDENSIARVHRRNLHPGKRRLVDGATEMYYTSGNRFEVLPLVQLHYFLLVLTS